MKRRQTFGDDNEEESNNEKQSRRLTSGSPSTDENFVIKKEYNGNDVNPSIYADYLKLDERYTDLETQYSEAMDRLNGFEQTKYEDEEFISFATKERDQAKKAADEAKAEKEQALKKMKDIELVNKNLGDDLSKALEANTTMKSQIDKMEERIKRFEAEEKKSGTAAKAEDDIAALKLQCDTLKNDYDIKIKEHVGYKESVEKLLKKYEKERNDELERASQASDKAEKLESEVMDLQAAIHAKNDKIAKMKEKQLADEKIATDKQTEQSAKIGELQKQMSEITVALKSKDDKMSELQTALDSSKQQLEHLKSTVAQQSLETATNADSYVTRINDLLASAKTKDAEIIQFQKQLAESAHHLSTQTAQTTEANRKVGNLVEQISDYCRIVKEKDQQISELIKKVSMQEKETTAAVEAEETSRSLERELKEARAEVLMMQEKLSKLQNELNNVQTQAENERISAAQERQSYTEEFKALKTSHENIVAEIVKIKVKKEQLEKQLKESNTMLTMSEERISKLQDEYTVLQTQLDNESTAAAKERQVYIEELENIKTSHENLAAENVKTKAEKDKLEKVFVDLRNALNAKISELEASILDRANKKFNEWKKKEKNVKVKIERHENTVTAAAVDVKEQMKNMGETVMEIDQEQKRYQPKWIISKTECCDIYISNKNKVSNFLQVYTSRLFNNAELMLPEEKQNQEKWNEAIAVIFYFWKPENDAQKKLCVGALKKKMKERRYHERSIAYKQCTENRLVAFTSNGRQFYYSFRKYGIWKPVADMQCTKILKFKLTHHSSFGIPTVLASRAEYILIIQDCPEDGQKIFKMLPSGYVECIFKKSASIYQEKKALKNKQ